MGIYHQEGGYSATIEAFVKVGEYTLRLAKTNGVTFSLSEPSPVSLSSETRAQLTIIVDGAGDSKFITLRDGLSVGQTLVKYDEVPF